MRLYSGWDNGSNASVRSIALGVSPSRAPHARATNGSYPVVSRLFDASDAALSGAEFSSSIRSRAFLSICINVLREVARPVWKLITIFVVLCGS